jgi:hypothetical protein
LLLALAALAAWCCRAEPLLPSQAAPPLDSWRRTAAGWEDSARWHRPLPVAAPPLHPLLLAAWQAAIALTLLAAARPPAR